MKRKRIIGRVLSFVLVMSMFGATTTINSKAAWNVKVGDSIVHYDLSIPTATRVSAYTILSKNGWVATYGNLVTYCGKEYHYSASGQVSATLSETIEDDLVVDWNVLFSANYQGHSFTDGKGMMRYYEQPIPR